MSLLHKLKSLFAVEEAQQPVLKEHYQDFEIIADPVETDGQYRINGFIRKGEREHTFIRADLLPSRESCEQETLRKARVMIDQQGDRLFNAQ